MHKSTTIIIPGGYIVKDKSRPHGWRLSKFNEHDHFGIIGDYLRVEAAAYIYQQNPDSIIIASGGKGQLKHLKNIPTLADVMAWELVRLKVPQSKIIKETTSANSVDQLIASAKIVNKKKLDNPVIISNKYHLPRLRAMINHTQELAKIFKPINTKVISAEQVCLKYDQPKWQKAIDTAYASQAMKARIKLEQQGVKDLKAGTYKSKLK